MTIRDLNDAFRQSMNPKLGRVLMAGELGMLPPEEHLLLISKVMKFNAFSKSNDPHGEHDFGELELAGDKVFWKIDYYEAGTNYNFGSDRPDLAEQTDRVLTIMLASDY